MKLSGVVLGTLIASSTSFAATDGSVAESSSPAQAVETTMVAKEKKSGKERRSERKQKRQNKKWQRTWNKEFAGSCGMG